MSLRYQSGSIRIEPPRGYAFAVATEGQRASLYPNVGRHFPVFSANRLTYRPTVQLQAGDLPLTDFGKKRKPRYIVRKETLRDVQNFEFIRQNRIVDAGGFDPSLSGPEPRDLFFRGGRRPDTGASAAYLARLGRDVSANELRPGYNRRRARTALARQEIESVINDGMAARPIPTQAPPEYVPPRAEIPVPGQAPIVIAEELPDNDIEMQTGQNAFGGPSDALPMPNQAQPAMLDAPVVFGAGTGVPGPNRASLRERQPRTQVGKTFRKPTMIRRVGPSSLPFAVPVQAGVQDNDEEMAVPLYGEATSEGVTDPALETSFAGGSGAGGGADTVNYDLEAGVAQNPDVAQAFAQDALAGHGQAFALMPDPSPAALEINVTSPDAVPLAHTDFPERVVQLAAMASNGEIAEANALRGSTVADVAETHITVEMPGGHTVTAHTGQSAIAVSSSMLRPEIRDDLQQAQQELDAAMQHAAENAEQGQPQVNQVVYEGAQEMTRAEFKARAMQLARTTSRSVAAVGAQILQGIQERNLNALAAEVQQLHQNRLNIERQITEEERQIQRRAQARRKDANFRQESAKTKRARKNKGKAPATGETGPALPARKRDNDDDDDGAAPAVPAVMQDEAESMKRLAEVIADKIKTVEPIQIGGANGPIAFRPAPEIIDEASEKAINGVLQILDTAASGKNKAVNRIAAGENTVVVGPSGRPIAVIPQGDAQFNSAPGPITVPRFKTVRQRAIERGVLDTLRENAGTASSGQLRSVVRASRRAVGEQVGQFYKQRVEQARKEKAQQRRTTASLAPVA